jgi:hypothetical protein
MSKSRSGSGRSSRRTFLKTAAGVAAGTVLTRRPLWAQSSRAGSSAVGGAGGALSRINPAFMITPQQAREWHLFKAQAGPTYAGSTGWKKFTDYVIAKIPEFGGVDFDSVDISYDHYIVDDWPDRKAHIHNSGVAVEKLVTDGTPVPVVASYGMTSGSTPPEGITAPMLFYDPARPPAAADIAGKILVFQTAPQPAPPYSNSFLDNYTLTDYEWRSPGKWATFFTPPPANVTNSYQSRWVWSQVGGFASIGLKSRAAGIVIVYDLSPGAAFGLTQRSVYTADGRAGVGAKYINCPTLTLDRVNGAKVLADAKAGKNATLTLTARFQRDSAKAFIAYVPGKNYGTPQDEQLLLATHTDAMSMIEENGAFGLLGIMAYFNKIPRAQRPRTLACYFDCRHFMPGGEGSWEEFDYYHVHPDRVKPLVATLGMEHMGGRQTIETGPGGNQYVYSSERPEDGGVITSLIDVHNNNIWLIETIARAATDNRWPRVDVKSGMNSGPGVNGGFMGAVKSPMNRGRSLKLPGIGLAGDWPGGWTQTYAQVDTEAGPDGFDKDYFVQQVAGLTQITGDLMQVKPIVIDLGWGALKTALVTLKDSAFVASAEATAHRQSLVNQYVSAFRHVEVGTLDKAASGLRYLASSVSSRIVSDAQPAIKKLLDAQLEKLG